MLFLQRQASNWLASRWVEQCPRAFFLKCAGCSLSTDYLRVQGNWVPDPHTAVRSALGVLSLHGLLAGGWLIRRMSRDDAAAPAGCLALAALLPGRRLLIT